MNVNSIPFNPKAMVLTAVVTFGSLAALAIPEQPVYQPDYSISQPTDYGVQTLQVFPNNTGIAVIKVDEFRIQVSFNFDAHPDSYGPIGSDYTAIDITNLAIESITDINGKSYNDFTDHNDHRNINLLLSDFIEKNKLAEAV
ncbi:MULTISPECIES: hypothetical protein [unclassified Acinetobacter]|uniref:hypothetical protein n=1 Tax=unclassified Acinetobacter TaxID=196816 RepID=UPI00293464DF|nr:MULTISPECIES: hypothetical protein [unclassified Acinetobacter]WOE32145.1 hypothetical protein QSG84_02725 [Acinetobacter sp. SAAs470]WOE37615.1 hypothetical protein QSG86_11770 [Acinetobacter sp. SAAs474]